MLRKVGDMIDGSGVTLDLEDEHLVSDFFVIAKVVDEEGMVSLAIGGSESMDWITQLGLLTAAKAFITPSGEE